VEERFSFGITAPVFGLVQDQMVSASTQDRTAGKDFETQSGWLFVALERWVDGALELTQEIETKDHSQEGRLGSEK